MPPLPLRPPCQLPQSAPPPREPRVGKTSSSRAARDDGSLLRPIAAPRAAAMRISCAARAHAAASAACSDIRRVKEMQLKK